MIAKYAPADTENVPVLQKKERRNKTFIPNKYLINIKQIQKITSFLYPNSAPNCMIKLL